MAEQIFPDRVGCLETFSNVRDIILDSSQNCIDRVNAAWRELEHLAPDTLPPALRPEWPALAERARRLSTRSSEPLIAADLDEAGDIGSILMCFERLISRDLMPATPPVWIVDYGAHLTA